MAHYYRVDFLVGWDVDDPAANSALDFDPASEVGGTAEVYLDEVTPGVPAVHLPAGFVIESFSCAVQWTPGIDGEALLVLNVDEVGLADIFQATRTLGPGTGITGTADFTPASATITVGSLPFTLPVEGWVTFSVIFDPSSPGSTVASGHLQLNERAARWWAGVAGSG